MDSKITWAVLVTIVTLTFAKAWAGDPHTGLPAFSPKGADTCLGCHEEPGILGIFSTPHAVATDLRTPFAQQQCESCHGPGGDHARRLRPGQERPAPMAFAAHAKLPKSETTGICLSCHQSAALTHWTGNIHEREGLACTDCHQLHAQKDPVTTRSGQIGVCLSCHTQVRAESFQASHHPIREGQTICSDCHQPHGSLHDDLLLRETTNQTCFECHAEKRGPFLWEHAPATEDCTSCHKSHGSNHPALLRKRPPLLCQECHSRAGHPGMAHTEARLPHNAPSAMLLLGSCTNCHSQVHGSNHPSGANLSR